MPIRFQIKRKKGWKKPANGVVVARPSKWGNPFKIGAAMSREMAIARYEDYIRKMSPERREEFLAPLRGKDLGCWCPLNVPCHADVLLKWASARPQSQSRIRRSTVLA
jgi:hypothetical protein